MQESSKFKGQHKTLACMLAIERQRDVLTHRYFVAIKITKTSATEAISLTVILYCILLLCG